MKGKIIFKEEQSFIGTWIWYIVIGILVITIGIRLFALTQAKNDTTDVLVGLIIAAIVLGGVIVLLIVSRLSVVIDENRIYYRFPPFVSKEKYFGKDDIKEMNVRKYKPILEYGGYGYRYRFRSGRAMNIAGNMGLQLVLKNGKKVLIGTQKPDSMQSAVRRLKDNWEMNG